MMSGTNFDTQSLAEILELDIKKYWIPDYQRGYKWGKKQVEALLDDIWEFCNKKQEGEIYSLQPLIVSEKEINNEKVYEVVDGQQRLTTIYLILKYLENSKESISIEYQIRTDSQEFLKNIESKNIDDAMEYIDYYYMFHAYETIKKWFFSSLIARKNVLRRRFSKMHTLSGIRLVLITLRLSPI